MRPFHQISHKSVNTKTVKLATYSSHAKTSNLKWRESIPLPNAWGKNEIISLRHYHTCTHVYVKVGNQFRDFHGDPGIVLPGKIFPCRKYYRRRRRENICLDKLDFWYIFMELCLSFWERPLWSDPLQEDNVSIFACP